MTLFEILADLLRSHQQGKGKEDIDQAIKEIAEMLPKKKEIPSVRVPYSERVGYNQAISDVKKSLGL